MSRSYDIYEDDLAELERMLPMWAERIIVLGGLDNALKTQIRRVQQILTNARWDYGPPSEAIIIPVDGPPGQAPPASG